MILLIDGSNAMWRAILSRANAELKTSKGIHTGAVVSFIHGILGHIERHKANKFAVVFDSSGGSFRKHLYPNYKGSREKNMEDHIKNQIPLMREAVTCMGGNLIDSGIYEADDVIASYAHKYADEQILIISDDKDLGSLVTAGIQQLRPCDGRGGKPSPILDKNYLKSKWEVEPHQISDVLALCGDGVDELIGVKGVGPVHAKKVLAQYGSLEQYALNVHEESGSRWMQRAASMTNVCLLAASTRLIKNIPLKELKARSADWPQQTIKLLKKLEAESAIKRVYKLSGQKAPKNKTSTGKAGRSLF